MTETAATDVSDALDQASLPAGTQRVVADAEARGIPIRVRERGPATSLAEAAAQIGIEPGALVKTLVIRRHDGTYLLALVPGGRKISWPLLRQAVGVNRLALPHADLAFEATGFERGTITPLGTTTELPVFADASIAELPADSWIGLGSGSHQHGILVPAAALLSGVNATVAPITDAE
ncbi:aminoacyl-tRNA deacylase [Mycetocola tolaasinivorans]|uniref:aminoacyl-tRNA deacylase n=1 Tax=Mycetocola tolaasinivorans TaxID=76635 RepID=UPI0016021C29|nr:YbaK/EbsC family protein [Mycetocola tolaasinivorans]